MRRLPAVLLALGLAAISAPAAALAQWGAPVDVPGASGGATVELSFDATGTATQLAEATVVRGGQAPDGRALLVLREQTTIPANQYGATTRLSYLLTSRGTATAFRPASLLVGSDDVAASSFAIRTVDEAGNVGGGPSLVSADGTKGTLPSAAAGPDGRLAATWQEQTNCEGSAGRIRRAAFAPAGGGLTAIAAPPFLPSSLAFTGNGSLYVARASRTVSRAGAVTMTLKPTRRGARTPRERGRLKAALTIVFRPSTGAAATKATRAVIFRCKR